METTGSVTRWLGQLHTADRAVREEAARGIYTRYFPELAELARRRLHPRIRARESEEDVVQRVFVGLFMRPGRRRFQLANRNDLRRLLRRMTRNKACTVAKRHRQEMRDVRREQPASPSVAGESVSPNWVFEALAAGASTPSQRLMRQEDFERRLDQLPEGLRRVARWRMEGYTNRQIADEMLHCSERNVERKLETIRKRWRGVASV